MGDIAFLIFLSSLTIALGDERFFCDLEPPPTHIGATSSLLQELLVLTSISVVDSSTLEVTYSKEDSLNFRFFLPSTKTHCLLAKHQWSCFLLSNSWRHVPSSTKVNPKSLGMPRSCFELVGNPKWL